MAISVRIDGDDLSDTRLLLNRAGIPTSIPFPAHHTCRQLDCLTAAVDAETEKDARARVSAVLPDGYPFELRQADRV